MTSKKNIVKNDENIKLKKLEKEISSLPKEQKLMLFREETTAEYSGILPPPAMLKEFDKVIPNGAERIMRMAEKEADERHENNKSYVKYNKLGLILGFVLACIALIGSFILAYIGNNIGAGGIFITVVSGVAIALIKGK